MATNGGLDGDERTPFARRADHLGELIERVAEADRLLATVAAHRAELVENARRWSIGTAAVVAATSSPAATSLDPHGWNAATVARRELISELACALRIPERTSENLIEDSRTLLTALPDTMKALTAGTISYRHVQTLIGHANTLPPDTYRGFETAVLPFAVKLTVAKFDRKARILRERLHPTPSLPAPRFPARSAPSPSNPPATEWHIERVPSRRYRPRRLQPDHRHRHHPEHTDRDTHPHPVAGRRLR